MTRTRVLLSSRDAALAPSSGVLRPPKARQQPRCSQARFLFNVFKHCVETRKNAIGRAALNDVPEGAREPNGDELLAKRGLRERHVC